MGKFTEFKLGLKSLPVGTHHYEFHLGKEFFVNMESGDVHDADLAVSLDVVHKNEAYDMTFHIAGSVTLICDRCLDSLVMPMDTTYHVTVEYGDDYNDESDDVLIIPQGDNYLNTAYMIYDTVALAIPIKHVHPAGQCNRAMSAVLKKHRASIASDPEDAELEESLMDGIDQDGCDCETEASTDPRWDELKKIK